MLKKTGLYDGAGSEAENGFGKKKGGGGEQQLYDKEDGEYASGNSVINIQLFASNFEKMGERQLNKSLKNLEKRVEEHKYKISNPQTAFSDWDKFDEARRNRELRHWNIEVNAFNNSIRKIKSELAKRSKK